MADIRHLYKTLEMKVQKVQYIARKVQRRIKHVPKIQITGAWLEELGFSIGDDFVVITEKGKITIQKQ